MVNSAEKKAGLISAVEGPIGLMALVVLVTEVILGLLATKAEGLDFTILLVGMVTVLWAVLFIVYKKSQELHSKIEIGQNNQITKVLVYKSQSSSYGKELHQYFKNTKLNSADFIEYSATTIEPILEELKNNYCKIRILLQHPDVAISQLQKNRISSSLDNLFRTIFETYDPKLIEFRFYCLPASIRGRNFDNQLVSVGWYTYSSDSEEYANIHGNTNPMINISTDNRYGQTLLRFFTKSFNHLWDHPGTVRLDSPWKMPIPSPIIKPKWYLTASNKEGQS